MSNLALQSAALKKLAKSPSKELIYKDARAWLLKAAANTHNEVQLEQQTQSEHAQRLLRFSFGRDLSLFADGGVEFRIHSIMLVGGPRYLEEQLSAPCSIPPTSVKLPKAYHPVLVDRLITFLYTKDYDILARSGALRSDISDSVLNNAWFVPDSTPALDVSTPVDVSHHMLHLHMYMLGEQLRYRALMTAAHVKLMGMLNKSLEGTNVVASLGLLIDCINACFAPPGTEARLCKDHDGMLQQTLVSAALFHEAESWNAPQRHSFFAHFPRPQYNSFWALVASINAENSDILALVSQARQSSTRSTCNSNPAPAREDKIKAEVERILAWKPTPAPPSAKNSNNGAYLRQDTRRRKGRKLETRQARAAKIDAVLANNADVFDGIDVAKVSANLAKAIGRSLALAGNAYGCSSRFRVDLLHSTTFAYAFTFQDRRRGVHANVGEFEGGKHNSVGARTDLDVDAELRDSLARMHIKDHGV